MLEFIKAFNMNYANAFSALTPFVLGIISWFYYKIYTEAKLKEGDAACIVKPMFWTWGAKYKISAVHKYDKSDDVSGYKHLSQNSRPDQWGSLINIDSNFCGFRHKVFPKSTKDILEVIISRNGQEKWKVIKFNK